MIRDWIQSDDFSASHLNEPLPAARSVESITAGHGVSVSQRTNATTISLDNSVRPNLISFPAQIIAAGPNGQADYSSAMYWVQQNSVDGDPDPGADFFFTPLNQPTASTSNPGYPVVFPALHLGEYTSDTHTLPTDGSIQVQVFGQVDTGAPAGDGTMIYRTRYWFMYAAPVVGVDFVVNLTKTSGAIGTKTTASTWLYTVKDLSNATTFGTGLSPQISRPNGALPFATLGKGYYDSSGTFHLLVAFETYGTGGC